MVMWGVVVGALIGWVIADFESLGGALGGLLGWGALSWLRTEMRREMRALLDEERGELIEAARPRAGNAVVEAPVAPPAAPAAEAPPTVPAAEAPPRREPARPWAETPAPVVESEPLPTVAEAGPVWTADAYYRPSPLTAALEAAKGWLFGGNTIVRAGLVILFVGLSFLARYAAMAGLFPIELRLALVAAFGIALLVIGFLRRTARPAFALTLQGGGVAILYLTIFGAARFFELLPLMPAFALMLLICVLGCALALLQDSRLLALASFAGGFAVPLLLGGEGSSIGLFSYYAILNLAVLALVWRKGWRGLALLAFLSTFGVMGAWVATSYTPADYLSTQAFLALFMAIHIGLLLLSVRAPSDGAGSDGMVGRALSSSLLFGPALAGLGIQIAIARHFELGSALSALGFAALYIAVAALLKGRSRAAHGLLVESLLAIGVGALTLAVPLALGASWTSSAWAVEGVAAIWIGVRQARWLSRAFGLALILVATLLFFSTLAGNVSAVPIVGRNTLGAVLVALPMLLAAWLLRTPRATAASPLGTPYAQLEQGFGVPLFLSGFLMWCIAIALEASRLLPPQIAGRMPVPAVAPDVQLLVMLLAILLSAGVALIAGNRLQWPVATWPSRAALPLIALLFGMQAANGHFVLHYPDWLFWLAALGMHFVYLYRNDQASPGSRASMLQRGLHVGTVWLLTAMLANCLWFGIDRTGLWGTDWAAVVFLLSGIAILVLLTLWTGRANRADGRAGFGWPLNPHAIGYWWIAAVPLAALVWLGALGVAFTASGKADPLSYVPLLNPVDLTLALALGSLLMWQRCLGRADPQPVFAGQLAANPGRLMLAALGFLLVNSVWLRIAHHYLGTPWTVDAMLTDPSVQAGLAILWTLLALGLMLFAHRRAARPIWLAGAALLGAVVLKLLLVDLSSAGGGQRIIAFIGVGVLMLVVGYFVPLPPRETEIGE